MKMVKVRGKLVRIETDPVQYKPYSPVVDFSDVYVNFEVPDTEIVETNEDGDMLLTMNGVTQYILRPFAEAVDDMNFELQKAQASKDTPTRRK
jgi:hypothetical protein